MCIRDRVKSVKDYDTKETVMENTPEVLSDNPIKPENVEAVKKGMGLVLTEGTAASVFSGSGIKAVSYTHLF